MKNYFLLKSRFLLFLTASHARTVEPTGPIFLSKNLSQKDPQNQKKFKSLAQLEGGKKFSKLAIFGILPKMKKVKKSIQIYVVRMALYLGEK